MEKTLAEMLTEKMTSKSNDVSIPSSNPKVELGQLLMKSRTDAHISHLLQKDKTLATHKALETYYETVVDMLDSFIESSMGLYEITDLQVPASCCISNPIDYFTNLYQQVQSCRSRISDDYLLNQIDEIQQLITQTLYRLKYIVT